MTTFNLFREMEQFNREMEDIFSGLGLDRLLEPSGRAMAGGRYPRVNLRQDAENVYVEALLPGIDPKELEMTVLKGVLTLSGERKSEIPDGATWHRRERGTGKFLRAIDIPAEVDVDRVTADFRDGLLTVTLPKAAAERPRRIEVKAR